MRRRRWAAIVAALAVIVVGLFTSSGSADSDPFTGMRVVYSDSFRTHAGWTPADGELDNAHLATLSRTMESWTASSVRIGSTTGSEVGALDGQLISDRTYLYGAFQFVAATEVGSGAGSALWLFPANGSWPPEIDVAEIPDGTRTAAYTNIHFGTDNQQYTAVAHGHFSKFTQWDFFWTPKSLEVEVNGRPLTWSYDGQDLRTTILRDPAAIPHIPMRIDLAMQKGHGHYWYPGTDSPPYHTKPVLNVAIRSVRVWQPKR